MNLLGYLKNLFKEDGFILVDANSIEHVIGKPKKEIPIRIRLLDKSLHYKLLLLPDLYFGEAYTDCLLYTSPSPRDGLLSRMPSSA